MRCAAQTAYFIDGYHGGIYGHLPSWQTRFMVDKLRQYPDWKINLELEPESWDSIALSDPSAYADFQRLFADQTSKGRIEYVNPSYGQSYLFNISGESIIRQFGYGMKTLRRHFPGAVFSIYSSEEPCFTSALPQILRSYGFKYASLKNPNTCWGGYTRAFGGELVNWVGPDGTAILTSPRYAVEALKPRSIWETIAAGGGADYVKAAFAYGIRHPVGMCLQDAGWAFGPWLRGGNYMPTVYETWRGYFENVAGSRGERLGLGVDVGRRADQDWKFSQEDVLVGLMWGAQVLQRIAREVRQSEHLIIQAEKTAAMAKVWRGVEWPGTLLDESWRTLLLSQHHDCWIVPYNGQPGNTWADKVVRWTGVTDGNSRHIIEGSLRMMGGEGAFVRVFNTTAVTREEYVHFGHALYKVKVPPLGYVTCRAVDTVPVGAGGGMVMPSGGRIIVTRSKGNWQVETDLYRLIIDATRGGAITSWIAKRLGNKEFVEAGKGFNELRGNFYNDGGMRSSTEKPATVSVLENGPAEVKIEIKGAIADNPFSEVLTLQMGQPRVDVHLRIDWKGNPAIGEYFEVPKNEEVRKAYYDDRYKLLALFPLRLDAQKVYKNAPFDVTESRMDNTFYRRWDSIKNNVLLDWVDVTDGGGEYGMALFSDHTTSYAHGKDFPLGLTVQYSGNGIFYRNYTIDGATELNYALLPHAGRWDKARIWTEGTKWSEPLIACAGAEGGERLTNDGGGVSSGTRSLLMPDAGVEVSSLRMEGDALVVRLFNAEASSPRIRVYLGFAADVAEEVELDGRQIRTLTVQKDKTGRLWIDLSLPRFGIRTIKFNHV